MSPHILSFKLHFTVILQLISAFELKTTKLTPVGEVDMKACSKIKLEHMDSNVPSRCTYACTLIFRDI